MTHCPAVQPSGASRSRENTGDRRELQRSRSWPRSCGQETTRRPCLRSGVLSPPEVNLTKGLKIPMCGQRFSDSGGSLEVHLRHHPITPELCRGNCLGPRAPPPFQDLCRVRPEQTFAKARGCSNPGKGPGAPARLAEPPAASAAPQEGWGASNSCLLKLPGATWLPHREGREARENWLA